MLFHVQRLARTLGETDKEIGGYKKLFEEFLSAPDEEWEARTRAATSPFVPRFWTRFQT